MTAAKPITPRLTTTEHARRLYANSIRCSVDMEINELKDLLKYDPNAQMANRCFENLLDVTKPNDNSMKYASNLLNLPTK
eukprot:Pgem_evm1s15013